MDYIKEVLAVLFIGLLGFLLGFITTLSSFDNVMKSYCEQKSERKIDGSYYKVIKIERIE